MRKILASVLMIMVAVSLIGCDIIQKEIERAQSIQLEEFQVNIHERTVLLMITSDADEQVIEEVVVNGQTLELIAQGDDWYLLEDIVIEKAYNVDRLYYRTSVGARLSFNIDYSITIEEAMDYVDSDQITTVTNTITIGDYTFSLDEESLIAIESDQDFTTEEIADWVWIILEDDLALYAVFEHDGDVFVVDISDKADSYID